MKPIYMLAFDHRASFSRDLLGIPGDPTPAEALAVGEAKRVIYEGFELALAGGVPRGSAGLLVDEQYGADVARAARGEGVVLAMPVEKSGRAEFEPESGAEFGAHIEGFDPTYAKVLVRYNVGGDAEMNRRQSERLARLGDWLHSSGREFLFELLVPAEPHQLESVGGDADRYDRELRPDLMIAAIRECQGGGVEPDIWKIEGLDSREDCVRLAEAAREGGREDVRCIVLGRGGDEAKVISWLQAGAGVPGFVGLAVGRTIWWDPLEEWLDGADAEDVAETIAGNYRRLVDAYAYAEVASR